MARKLIKQDLIGDGAVRYRIVKSPDSNQAMIGLQIDYAEAPIPQHYYVADYFYVKDLGYRIMLAFGKFEGSEERSKLRSKLEIYVPAVSFLRTILGTTADFHETLRKFGEKMDFPKFDHAAEEMHSEKIQTMQSNNILMAVIDGEPIIDFFYISPRDLHYRVAKKENIPLEALVRVMIDPPMILAFLDECVPIAEGLSKKFPKGEEYDYESDKMESR